MRNYSTLTKVGNVRSGEVDTLFIPGIRRPNTNFGVVLLHGSSAPWQYINVQNWATTTLVGLITAAGIPCVSAEMSGQAFGNSNAMTDIDNAITYMSSTLDVPSSKVHLIGVSMGGYTGLRYASLNPSKVASYTGLIPLCDIVTTYNSNTLGLQSQIGTAWGVTYPTPLPGAADITSSASSMNGVVPSRFYYSDVDAAVPQASVLAMAATVGAPTPVMCDTGSYGHNEGTIQGAINAGGVGTAKNIIDFLIANGA